MDGQALKRMYEDDLENVSSLRKDVTVCFKLSDTFFHVTATYLGDEPSQETFDDLYAFMQSFDGRSVQVQVVGKDWFGLKKDITVLLVKFDEATQQKVIQFHQKHGKPEPGWAEKLKEPKFHISVKTGAWFDAVEVGTTFALGKLATKRLGPVDPFYEVLLQPAPACTTEQDAASQDEEQDATAVSEQTVTNQGVAQTACVEHTC